jgi:hypothetical protein
MRPVNLLKAINLSKKYRNAKCSMNVGELAVSRWPKVREKGAIKTTEYDPYIHPTKLLVKWNNLLISGIL